MWMQPITLFFSLANHRRSGGCLSLLLIGLLLAGCQTESGSTATRHPAGVGSPYPAAVNHAALAREAAFGTDSLSASTNFSRKVEDPAEKASGLTGAAFVAPPQVGNDGAVTLRYAVDVPKGRAGMEPAVGLSYASGSGDGLLGMGWSLATGLDAIVRITKHGPLFYDTRDTFAYNGKRLVKVSGPAGSETGLYRQEIESDFLKLELSDVEQGGIWKLTDQAGTITWLGHTAASRLSVPGQPTRTYAWKFSHREDLNGNTMVASYDLSDLDRTHLSYLQEIRYTGNTTTGLAAHQFVRFGYVSRPDPYVSNQAGFLMTLDRLLDTITVGWDDPHGADTITLWDYRLVYEPSEDSHRPLLKTVISSRESTRPVFDYLKGTHHLVWRRLLNPDHLAYQAASPSAIRVFQGDFNGDGLSDLVHFNPETGLWRATEARPGGGFLSKTYGQHFQGYATEKRIRWFKDQAVGDYNGDGRADIAFFLPQSREFRVAEHTGQGFVFKNYGRLTLPDLNLFQCQWFTGDFDGNGLSDTVLFDEATGSWILMRSQGDRFAFSRISRRFQHLFRDDYVPDHNQNSPATLDDSEQGRDYGQIRFFSGDYNGDGRTDIGLYDHRTGYWSVGENHPDADAVFRLEWKRYQVFSAPDRALFSHKVFSGDTNGDGRSDFLIYDPERQEWLLGATGQQTVRFTVFSRMPPGVGQVTRWFQGDFNGDGRSDVGFTSGDDHRLWVGEALPDGFRYRIYGNTGATTAPPSKELWQTPLPKEEVVIKSAHTVLSHPTRTDLVTYAYNANPYGKGTELPFLGYFRSHERPSLVLYDRSQSAFYEIDPTQPAGTAQRVLIADNIDLAPGAATLLNRQQPLRYLERDALLVHRTVSDPSGTDQIFELVQAGTPVQRVAQARLTNFDIQDSLVLTGHFATSDRQALLLLEDQAPQPQDTRFLLCQPETPTEGLALTIDDSGSLKAADFFHLFHQGSPTLPRNRLNREQFSFFTGDMTGSGLASVLMVDRRQSPHRWYLGTLDLSRQTIRFQQLTGNYQTDLPAQDWDGRWRIRLDGTLLLATTPWNGTRFHAYRVAADRIQVTSYGLISSDYGSAFQFDQDAHPILTRDTTHYRLVLGESGQHLTPLVAEPAQQVYQSEIKRPDLASAVYPYRWLQGDYNGDNKTDLALVHPGEPTWYLAQSSGEISDTISRVQNGIGGTYRLRYRNSTALDNTGPDNIPDLPLNLRLCSELRLFDGLKNEIVTTYDYADGAAFSAVVQGRKETDFFGFGTFTVTTTGGAKTIHRYHRTPYDDYLKNRALAGALQSKRVQGTDIRDYALIEYAYTLHEVRENAVQAPSFLVEPTRVKHYERDHITGTLVPTSETVSHIALTPNRYQLASRTVQETDVYEDGVHSSTTLTTYQEYESLETTNETRLVLKQSYVNTPQEISTQYAYDDRGNVEQETTTYTGSGLETPAPRILHTDYDAYGNAVRISDRSASPHRISETEVDGKLHQFVVAERQLKATGHLETRYDIDYGSAFGSIRRIMDANLNSRYLIYDERGRLIREDGDTESGVQPLSTYVYSHQFPLSAKTVQHAGDGTNVQTRVFSDGLGRPLRTVQSALAEAGKRYTRSGKRVYDGAGRLIRESQPDWARDEEIDAFRFSVPEKHPTRYQYDAIGRRHKVISPPAAPGETASFTETIYEGPWQVTETHSSGRGNTTVTNARDQVLYVTDFGTGDDGGYVEATLGFAYDAAGRRVKKMDLNTTAMDLAVDPAAFDPAFRDTSGHAPAYFRYDGLGQLIAAYDPDRGYEAYQHNAFGERTAFTDALGRTTAFHYDRLGRLIQKMLPGLEGTVTYTYDTLASGSNLQGRLAALDDPAQRKTFSYDKLGRRVLETRTFQNPSTPELSRTYQTAFAYDLLDRVTTITYPQDPRRDTSVQVTYAYNGMSLVERVLATTSQGTQPLISDIRYNPFKQMDSLARANGVRTDYEYDTRRRLKRLVSLRDGDQTRRLQDVSYTFDSYDNIQRIVNHPTEGVSNAPIGPTEMSYRYDGLNRLIDAEGAFEPEDPSADLKAFKRYYDYAQNGNLMRKDIVHPDTHAIQDRWTYGYDTHQATGIATTLHGPNRITMQYDAVGNLIHQADAAQNKAKQLVYSSENQLTVVTDPLAARVIGRYVYDDQGFRVYRQARHQNEGGQTVNFEVGYPNQYLSFERQTDDGGNELPDTWAVANHVYLNGVRVAAIGHNGYANYYLTDQVDSVKLVTDNDGSAITRHEYLPYGESWFTEGAKKTAPKFNSQELDKETGYYYYNARHYDPEISRFTTADAVIPNLYDTQNWNRYSYVKGNPIRYKDPTGHYDVDEKGKGDHRTKKGREASRKRERAHERSRPEAAKADEARRDKLQADQQKHLEKWKAKRAFWGPSNQKPLLGMVANPTHLLGMLGLGVVLGSTAPSILNTTDWQSPIDPSKAPGRKYGPNLDESDLIEEFGEPFDPNPRGPKPGDENTECVIKVSLSLQKIIGKSRFSSTVSTAIAVAICGVLNSGNGGGPSNPSTGGSGWGPTIGAR